MLAASALALGCSARLPVHYPIAGAAKSSDFERVVLLPMNYDYAPSAELAAGVEMMSEELRHFLEASGYEVIAPRMSTTLAIWKECTDELGGLSNDGGKNLDEEMYERARSELALRTLDSASADSASADGVIAATVVVRKGRYAGKVLHWDGVSREVPIDIERTTRGTLWLKGVSTGTSLRTSVFDREGRLIFERYVGLEPIHGYEVVGSRYQTSVRKDLFRDEAIIEEGIALSFQPWLVQLPEPK